MGDKLFCILEASQGPYGKTRMLEFFAFLWQNLWRALWRHGCWISSLQKWLGSWKTGPWLVRAQHVIWCVVRPGHGRTTSAQSDIPEKPFVLSSSFSWGNVFCLAQEQRCCSLKHLTLILLCSRRKRPEKKKTAGSSRLVELTPAWTTPLWGH